MADASPHRTLIVANRTAATAALVEEVKRRAGERPTEFGLLIPNVERKDAADWTLENALPLLERAAHGKVEGIVGGLDPFESVKNALAEGAYDDVLISTLPQRLSEWLRRDLPHRVEKLGVPVAVLTAKDERAVVPGFAGPGAGP